MGQRLLKEQRTYQFLRERNISFLRADHDAAATIEDCRLVDEDEIVTEIVVPASMREYKMGYDKYRVRDSHDFAVVSVAAAYKLEGGKVADARIVLGAVAPIPLRAAAAEAFIAGKEITEELAAEAAEIALSGAIPLSKNEYKVQIARTLVKNSLLNARAASGQ